MAPATAPHKDAVDLDETYGSDSRFQHSSSKDVEILEGRPPLALKGAGLMDGLSDGWGGAGMRLVAAFARSRRRGSQPPSRPLRPQNGVAANLQRPSALQSVARSHT